MMDRSNCTAPRHGTVNAYRRGCRCDDSREARRLYMKRRREGRLPAGMIPAIGTARRLQALAAIGWSLQALADRSDLSKFHLYRWRSYRYQFITAAFARRIGRLYDHLQGSPGPSLRAREWAAEQGWSPPLAWDNIDNPAEVPALSEPEKPDRPAEVMWLVKGGVPLEEALPRVGMTLASWDRLRWRRGAA